MGQKLFIVEFKEEVELFVKDQPEILLGGSKVISLLPEASEALLKNGIVFETSVPYFSKESHERCLERVDAIIRGVNANVHIQDSHGLKNAYTNALTFYFRQYLGYVISIIEIISNVCEKHGIEEIVVCRYAGNDHTTFALTFKERILGEIAGLFAPYLKITSQVLNVPKDFKPDPWRKRLKSLICAVLFPIEIALLKKRNNPSMVYYSFKYRFDTIARSFKDCDHYNVAPDVKSFAKLTDQALGFNSYNIHLPDLVSSPDKEFARSINEGIDAFKTSSDNKQLCVWRGRDFSGIVYRKIDQGYVPQLRQLNRTVRSLKRFLKALKPAVVLSHVARDFSYALGELATVMNIPSVLISHGSHVPPQNKFDRMEWFDHGKGLVHTDYRYHLLQSPWAVEHVRAMGYQGKYFQIEPIIFPTVDRSEKQVLQLKMYPKSDGKKIVVHAGTPKPRGSNRFYIYETLDEYVAFMRDLIEEARKLPDVFLVIRFRPYPYLSTSQLKALLPAGDDYVIATEGSFADYLKIADVMVSFSSTTIEEALINGIPVLQYDPSNRYVHIPGAVWQDKGFAHVDSVYYIGERRGLAPGLKWIIANHLKSTTVGDLFERHVFKQEEAISVQEFIRRLINNDLPKPIDLKAKPHIDGVEIY